MLNNFLKLNDQKTKNFIPGSWQQLTKVTIPHVNVGDSEVTAVTKACNLGVIFDSSMTLSSHIARSTTFHIGDIGSKEILDTKCN